MNERLLLIVIVGIVLFLVNGPSKHIRPEEISDIYPFPPGKNANLVKKICSECHDPVLVVTKVYSKESARAYYQSMVGDPDSEQGQKVIEYLLTVLGLNY